MKNIVKLSAIIYTLLFISCANEPSLQQYFINHQEDKDFIAVDVPSSLLDAKKIELSSEEQDALTSIKKVNFLAMPLKDVNQERFHKEKTTINAILGSDKYETLMRFGTNGTKGVLKYIGDDDAIDEVIVFGSHKEKGLALVRVLGDDMKASNIALLVKTIEKGNLDLDGLKEITKALNFD